MNLSATQLRLPVVDWMDTRRFPGSRFDRSENFHPQLYNFRPPVGSYAKGSKLRRAAVLASGVRRTSRRSRQRPLALGL
eukprot:COSAG01_NODE_2802_length_7049_cov_2.441871_8_plen_79_part_00